MHKVHVVGLGAFGALLAVSAVAFAGIIAQDEVTTTENSAQGTVSGAFLSADGLQQIGCTTQKNLHQKKPLLGICGARDANHNWRQCSTHDPEMIQVMQSVGPGSYVSFRIDEGGFECDFVFVSNASPYMHY